MLRGLRVLTARNFKPFFSRFSFFYCFLCCMPRMLTIKIFNTQKRKNKSERKDSFNLLKRRKFSIQFAAQKGKLNKVLYGRCLNQQPSAAYFCDNANKQSHKFIKFFLWSHSQHTKGFSLFNLNNNQINLVGEKKKKLIKEEEERKKEKYRKKEHFCSRSIDEINFK